jgi:diguanylate cyclase (GGDEF)-like protein
MSIGAAAAYAIALAGDDRAVAGAIDVPWPVLALGFAATANWAVHLHFRAETHTITLDEVVLVIGLFAVSPAGLVAAQVLGAAFVLGLVKRLPALKVAYNLAQLALGTIVATIVFRSLASLAHPLAEQSWIAAFAACAVLAVIAMPMVATAIVITEGRAELDGLTRSFVFGFVGTVVNTMLGLVAVIVLSESMVGATLLVGPIIVVFVAYRAYVSEKSKSEGLEFLYAASEVLNSARDVETGLISLLDFARDSFHAEVAEIVIFGEDTEAGDFRTGVGPGSIVTPLGAVDRPSVERLLACARQNSEAVIHAPARTPVLEPRHGFEAGSELVAPLFDESGLRGAVVLARGRAAAEPFGREDARLFETFANHLGTTLEKLRLHTSLAQLREAKQELAYQAYHDSLTGLANRALFGDRVAEVLARTRAEGGRVAVLFIDLDDFKTVNDTMGHAAGDALLTEVGRRIERCIGPEDVAARLGGDEFAVLIAKPANEVEARGVADRILVSLGDPIAVDGQPVVMQASIGIAGHDGATDAAELMQHADVAMYTAKRNGKGRFSEFEPNMSLTVAHRHRVKLGLERALIGNEFVLHYQPVIEVDSGRLVAVEALLRWEDPTRGLMPPNEFVGVAEETGLIVPIGRWVLASACHRAAEWSAHEPDLQVFVNLSTRQIAHPDIVGDVCNALAESGLRPQQLQLEVTETAMMHDIGQAADVLRALKSIGVGIAIDDFGTGFSSLSYLRQLPIDVLKIAKPIVDSICESTEDAAFVKGIVELGHVVGLKVVAEGVERVEQYARLVDMGCDLVQGFYYASSMEPHDVTRILAAGTPVPPEARVVVSAGTA